MHEPVPVLKAILAAGVATAAIIAVAWYAASAAKAADKGGLGGNCCADLEERVAELEATAARKGNRKVTLTISGEVSKAVLYVDGLDGAPWNNKLRVIDNTNSGTKVRITGEGKASSHLRVGFLVEWGINETRGDGLGPTLSWLNGDTELRHSAAWIETAAGRTTLGRTSFSTDGVVAIDLSNTTLASRPMSFEPLWSYLGLAGLPPPIGGNTLNPAPFHDLRGQVVRYDSPVLGGFTASAAWGGGQSVSGDDAWDVALRYAGEFSGLRLAAGAGYRVDSLSTFGAPDTKTLSGSASAKHMTSGLFVGGGVARQQDNPLFGDIRMWHVRAGIEINMTGVGLTSVFGEYGDHRLPDAALATRFFGGGVVQQLTNAGLDVFVAVRRYDSDALAGDVTTALGGVRVQF